MLTIVTTIGSRHTLQGGVVECDKCHVRWECATEAVCAACSKRALCDVQSGIENACCVDCLTDGGDGVRHADVCDGCRYCVGRATHAPAWCATVMTNVNGCRACAEAAETHHVCDNIDGYCALCGVARE